MKYFQSQLVDNYLMIQFVGFTSYLIMKQTFIANYNAIEFCYLIFNVIALATYTDNSMYVNCIPSADDSISRRNSPGLQSCSITSNSSLKPADYPTYTLPYTNIHISVSYNYKKKPQLSKQIISTNASILRLFAYR